MWPSVMATIQLKRQQGIVDASKSNPVEGIQSHMAAAVKANLSPDQAARYQAEIDARTKFEQGVAARVLVARFGPQLELSSKQRARIVASLSKSSHIQSDLLDGMVFYTAYAPAVPDDDIVPYLDDHQKTIWHTLPRVRVNLPINRISGINLQEDDMAEEDAPAVAAEAARKRTEQEFNAIVNGMLRMKTPSQRPPQTPGSDEPVP